MSNQWLGFWLSLLTAALWGILPVFIKLCLQVMDSTTITWYRFAFAALLVFLVLLRTKALPNLHRTGPFNLFLVALAAVALVLNYVANVEGLEYIDAETTQVVMQLAPLMLMFGGILLYKERFSRLEGTGTIVLLIGLLLFFKQQLAALFGAMNDYNYGVLLVVFAAACWAAYALLQKKSLRVLTAKQLTFIIYSLGVVMLIPFVDFGTLMKMNMLQLGALLFCCLNTVVAYGAFTEALAVWNASKVSAVLALSPVFTFLSMKLALLIWPMHFVASELSYWSYIGAILVVVGSITAALGRGKRGS